MSKIHTQRRRPAAEVARRLPRTRRPPEVERRLGERADEDLEASAPPLAGKVHPPHDMRFVVPAPDDDRVPHPHHPNDSGVADFEVNPDAADAARDLAGDLGAQFLEGVTFGEDVSERAIEDAEANDAELPFLIDHEAGELVVEDEPEPEAPPRARQPRRRSKALRR